MKALVDRLIHSLPGVARSRDDSSRLGREAARLFEEGRYHEARDVARRLVDRLRERPGERRPEYASALTDLALSLQTLGDLDAAEPLLREALEVREAAFGARDPRTAASLGQLGDLLRLRGDLDGAEPLLRRALEIRAETVGDRHPDHAAGLVALGLLLVRRGDPSAAEPLLRQALEIRRATLGDRHPLVAAATESLGLALQRRGDLDAAERLFRRALELRYESLEDDHPDVGASLSRLGTLNFERGNSDAAEPLLRQAVTVRKPWLGADHPDVVADLQTLEAILQARSRPVVIARDARTHATVALAIPAAANDRALESLGRGAREIGAEVRALAESFARVGDALERAAQTMRRDGLPPEIEILNDANACRLAFATLHDEALHRAETLDLAPSPHDGTAMGLPALVALMDRVASAEEELPRRAAARRRALTVLDGVLALRHRVAAEAPLLRYPQEMALSLRGLIASARLTESLPHDASRLASGTHPLAALLQLADSNGSLSDDEWSRLHRETASSFSRPLAAAAGRGRLELVSGVASPLLDSPS